MSSEEAELIEAIESVLKSPSKKKLIVAGPGTGKTTLFKMILKGSEANPNKNLVLTFINNLCKDLEKELSGLASVYTLHSYCLGLLYRESSLRSGLSSSFKCLPGLGGLIKSDWRLIENSDAPQFIREMRNLNDNNNIDFYLSRGAYYDAVDFDDTVYRVYTGTSNETNALGVYDKVLIDEYQDFNKLEAVIINRLANNSPILIVGDDDQALYSQLRDSSWDYIRTLYISGDYEIFELPFCMRCPEVIVEAVSDIISQAQKIKKLHGRIDKPFKHFPPVKGADSEKYPKISLVRTSVQRQNANYMGRYIEQAIKELPREEIEEATKKGYPAVLIIAAKPYRPQITEHLESTGITIDTRQDPGVRLDHTSSYAILKEDIKSNLGWRIILEIEQPSFLEEIINKTNSPSNYLFDIIPNDFKDQVMTAVDAWEPPDEKIEDEIVDGNKRDPLTVRVTSFEGAKGLSAQHVFIVGLHNSELPRNPNDIKDIEICKFVVSLTRTRKKCSLLFTGRFANQQKSPSIFLSWIGSNRFERINIDSAYWENQS